MENAAGNPLLDFGIAAAASLFFGLLWFFSKGRWMGFGDVKLIFVTSLLVGFPAAIPALLFAFWVGAIGGLAFLAISRISIKHAIIPFGPYILIGALLGFFLSDWFFFYTGFSFFFGV